MSLRVIFIPKTLGIENCIEKQLMKKGFRLRGNEK